MIRTPRAITAITITAALAVGGAACSDEYDDGAVTDEEIGELDETVDEGVDELDEGADELGDEVEEGTDELYDES